MPKQFGVQYRKRMPDGHPPGYWANVGAETERLARGRRGSSYLRRCVGVTIAATPEGAL